MKIVVLRDYRGIDGVIDYFDFKNIFFPKEGDLSFKGSSYDSIQMEKRQVGLI